MPAEAEPAAEPPEETGESKEQALRSRLLQEHAESQSAAPDMSSDAKGSQVEDSKAEGGDAQDKQRSADDDGHREGTTTDGTVIATAAGERTTAATIDATTTGATRGAIGGATRVPVRTPGCEIAAVRAHAAAIGDVMTGRRNRRLRRKSPHLTSPPSRQPWHACRVFLPAVPQQVSVRFLASCLRCSAILPWVPAC